MTDLRTRLAKAHYKRAFGVPLEFASQATQALGLDAADAVIAAFLAHLAENRIRLVPEEATEEMRVEGQAAINACDYSEDAWREMLSAAPTAADLLGVKP